jgi:hypothetical protein
MCLLNIVKRQSRTKKKNKEEEREEREVRFIVSNI